MTAQFYRTPQEDKSRAKLWYATALVVIIFLLDTLAGGRLRQALREPAGYLYLSFSNVGEALLSSGIFASRHSLEAENARLRENLAAYKDKDAIYAAMRDENARLRTLTGLSARLPGKAALVVSSPFASAFGTFTVDAGIEEGVSRGATVYTADGFSIGTVSETGPHTALVTQLFAPGSNVEAIVSAEHLVLEGQGGGNARARAPRGSAIAIGDVVRAPSVDAPVGVVEHVTSESTGADKEIYVRIPANLQTLTLVYVGRK